MFEGRRIHLCVTGGIAAYKAVELARAFIKAGATVQVAMTQSATQFVGPLTFQGITHQRVLTRTLDPSEEMEIGHIAFAQECDALVIAPATANLLGKAAAGIGDDVVSTVLLAATVPVIAAPAMNTFMYQQPAVQANLATLSRRGWRLVEPEAGELACGHVGPGRLPPTEAILATVEAAWGTPRLKGRHIVVSAGPTREHLDPVRFLSNPSSGRTGFAVAAAARSLGAQVTLVHGPVAIEPPAGVQAVPVISAEEMNTAMLDAAADADAVVMSAAVADWRPATASEIKEKKRPGNKVVEFVRTPDILAGLGTARTGERPVLVGFAAETGDPIESARGKLSRKGVDLIVANDVSAPDCGFEGERNRVWFVSATGEEALPLQAKTRIAERLVQWIADRLERG
jgi:phosphopantothenoylcysteine decarboxylase/phosphopantothenate--cysteine ligase